jgi:protein CpxP
MMKRMFSKLDLSEEQKAGIKALREETKAAMMALYDEEGRADFHDQMQALVKAESFDEAAFRALMETKAAKKMEAGVIKAKMKNGVWNLLDAEQQQKLEEMMEQKRERRQNRRSQRGYHHDGDSHE